LQQLKILFFGMRKGMENAEWIICSRRRMLAIRKRADHRDNPTSLYHGQRILACHLRVGDDNRWHAQVVLADRSYVFLEEPEYKASIAHSALLFDARSSYGASSTRCSHPSQRGAVFGLSLLSCRSHIMRLMMSPQSSVMA